MFGGVASNPKAGEPPKRQPRQPAPASAIPVALHAQHQHVPPALMGLGVAGRPAATWTAAQHEEWLRAMAQPSAATATAAGVRRPGVSASMPSSVLAPPPRFSHTHDKGATQQVAGKETGKANERKRQAGQMGSGALSNAIGAWTSSGIFVSRTRAGRVDESVDVGAQANPSGVYPVMQPMAFLPRPQPPPNVPASHMIRGNSGSQKQQQQQQQGARVAAATNPRPQRAHAHPAAFGPGVQHLPHEAAYSRPVSAPAGSVFNPGGGAFKRPPPPSPGVGLRRTSTTATRGKAGSAVAGAGSSKAAMRAAARAAAAASVISAVADSRKTEARVAAAVAAAGVAAAAGAAAGSTGLEAGNVGQPKGGSKRERKGRGIDGDNLAQGQPRRPATAPASSAAAVAATKHPHPHPLSFPHASVGSFHMAPWNAGVPVPVPMPMPMPSEWADQWARGQGRLDTLPAPAPPQPPPRHPSEGLALNAGTTVATPAAAAAAAAAAATAAAASTAAAAAASAAASAAGRAKAHTEAQTAKSARMSPVQKVNSSSDSEDTYTDSWLTGMPWASSSPPNAEGLEVEVPESPAPLDALRSDDRGTRDVDDDDDVGDGDEAVLFMDHHPTPTPNLQEVGGKNGAGVQLALQASGGQHSAPPFPQDGDNPLVGSTTAGAQSTTGESRQPVVCAGGDHTSAPVVITAGMDADAADTHHGQQPSSQLKFPKPEAAPDVVSVSAGVRDTGGGSGGTSTVVPKLPPMGDARSSSPRRVTGHGHASDNILAQAVKGSYPDDDPTPRPSASSSSSSVEAAAAATAAAVVAAVAGTTAASPAEPAALAAAIPTASAPANLLSPPHQDPSSPPSVPPPPSSVVADPPTLQQPLSSTAATSLPDWAHHPPPLPGLDDTSLTSTPDVCPRQGPGAATRPTNTTPVRRETTAAAGPMAEAADATRTAQRRSIIGTDNSAGGGGSPGGVTKGAASPRRRVPETSTAAAIRAAAAAGLGTARGIPSATTKTEAKPATEAPATPTSWGCTDGGRSKSADCEAPLPNIDRPRGVGSTPSCYTVGGRSGGRSSPRGSKRSNDAETGEPQPRCEGKSVVSSHGAEGVDLSRETRRELPGETAPGEEKPMGEVGGVRKSPTRCHTQHKRDGTIQPREDDPVALGASARNDEQGLDGDKGATATRRSKRRRSSGNLLQ